MEPDNKFLSNNIGAIHILYIRGDGQKIQRNTNAALLEKFCATYFYGPLCIVFSSTSHPPQLLNCNPEDLVDLPFNRTPDNKLIKCLMEMSEFNRNLEEYQTKLSTYAFAMFRYKTSWCPKITQKHDWAQCIYAHRLQDFRRPPDIYEYSSEDCTIIIHKDCSWEGCPDGLLCKYSHTTFERLYHPSKFKLVPCEKKVCNRDEMCAFYHKPEEKLKVEQESETFFDPLVDYEEEYDQEVESTPEQVSEHKTDLSNKSIPNTNTNIIPEPVREDSEIQPNHRSSFPSSDRMIFEECNEENMWANGEFELEAILQKTKSLTQNVDFEAIALDSESPKLFNSDTKPHEKCNSEVASTPNNNESKSAKTGKLASCEIKNIVLGNGQKIETSKIIENICSIAPKSEKKSKFFHNFNDDRLELEDDLLNDILCMDYDTFCRKNEGKQNKNIIQSNSLLYEDNNALHIIHEEVETCDSNRSETTFNQQFKRHI